MTSDASGSRQSDGLRTRRSGVWAWVLDFALILWVVRVPLAMTALGLLLLGLVPQAQDLFVEFAASQAHELFVAFVEAYWRIPLFLLLLVFVWAMPTHYAARLLLDTDERFQKTVADQRAITARYVPRALGLVTFVAVLIAIWRSHLNLPSFSDANDKLAVVAANQVLLWLAVLVVVVAVGFLIYTIIRPRNADIVGLRA